MNESATTRDAISARLVNCFAQVFPALDRSAIPSATQDTVGAWDSIAQVTLVSLIGEEFGFEIDFEEFEEATSFGAMLDVVNAKAAGA